MNYSNDLILAVDTSADDTCAAVVRGRRVLSNVRFSQIPLHQQYGGIFPTVAKRAHVERIDGVIARAMNQARCTFDDLQYLAVTYGPGLAPSLLVGVNTIKELSQQYSLPIIPVNHMEGHIFSCFAENRNGLPSRELKFPLLAFLVSGGHTELVEVSGYAQYTILGKTVDDAAGEALDKAARLITGAGYPGGPLIEKLALQGDANAFSFPIPMTKTGDLQFSYSGLKTALLYIVRVMSDEERARQVNDLAASFQHAIFRSLLWKLDKAIDQTGSKLIAVGGGVSANRLFRKQVRALARSKGCRVYFPPKRSLEGDNAAMIGIAAALKVGQGYLLQNSCDLEHNSKATLQHLEYSSGQESDL